MGDDGTIVAQGSYAEVLVKDEDLAREAAKENEKISKATEEPEDADDLTSSEVVADGKLIVKEEIAEGHISLRARQCSFLIFPYFFAQIPRSEPLLNGSRRQAPASILDGFCWWRLCASRPCELPGQIVRLIRRR